MSDLLVERVHAVSRPFVHHHAIRSPGAGETLVLGERVGKGSFGTIHAVEPDPASGRQPAILSKLYNDGPGERQRVIGLLERVQRALSRCSEPEWPQLLLALPFALVEGQFEGESRLVALMLDLRALGYEVNKFGADQAYDYQGRGSNERLDFAYNFARGARLLESISFVHADLNFENLLFHASACDVQIHDFDGGVLAVKGDEIPAAAGKRDSFLPPEAVDLRAPGQIDASMLTREAERWSVGTLVGHLLFGHSPHVFLREASASVLDAYARQPLRWPQIDRGSAIFNLTNETAYEELLPVFESAPEEVRARLGDLFDAGSNGAARPTAAAWVAALETARRPPVFDFLRAEPDLAVEGGEITISWRADGAESVQSKLFGSLGAEGSETIVVGQATRFEFEAINRFGSIVERTNAVRVVPLPRIERIPLPAFPGFQASLKIPGAMPALPGPPPAPPRFSPAVRLAAPPSGALPRLAPRPSQLPRLPSLAALLGTLGSTFPKRGR